MESNARTRVFRFASGDERVDDLTRRYVHNWCGVEPLRDPRLPGAELTLSYGEGGTGDSWFPLNPIHHVLAELGIRMEGRVFGAALVTVWPAGWGEGDVGVDGDLVDRLGAVCAAHRRVCQPESRLACITSVGQ
ncbi:hypothetical protein [Microbacterium halophytorum]|uniref:hypothetical protein n=1 Tax=Microbacterium halophytorum TaxID=2067568 RepID=UPI001319BE92|nr:hypothetical protein [Microbacterium halophytorum]